MTDRRLPIAGPEPTPEHSADADRRPSITRRDLGRLLGASAALASAGCGSRPQGTITTGVEPAPETTPGVPLEFATSMTLDGFAVGLVARSRAGRPIKIEGNPEHPASLGATDPRHQAAVLGLYDPDRLRAVTRGGEPGSWLGFFDHAARLDPGTRLWVLMHPQSSPHIEALLDRVRDRFPETRVVHHTPIDRRAVYRGAERALGRPLEAQYDFSAADVVVSLGADFTASMPMSLRWARHFAARRRLQSPGDTMCRLYIAESAPSPTGAVADHHVRVRPGDVSSIAAALWLALGDGPAADFLDRHGLGRWAGTVAAAASDLGRSRGRGLVIAGDRQPAEVHALAHLINQRLGNAGATVRYTEPALSQPLEGPSLADFARAARAGQVDAALLVESNPAYTAAPELDVAGALARVPSTIHLTQHANETSAHCRWVLPAAHFLESWGDGRAYDGTVSLIQPLTRPLWGGRTAAQILYALAGGPGADDRALHTAFWRQRLAGAGEADVDRALRRHLRRGFLAGSASPALEPAATGDAEPLVEAIDRRRRAEGRGLELELPPSESVYDGRFANNAWLLELPHSQTKLTWDNAALMSPDTAASHGLSTGGRVEIAAGGRTVTAPVLALPGHADDCVTLALGFGRAGAERTAAGVGVSAYPLRDTEHPFHRGQIALRSVPGRHRLARAQLHFDQHERHIALHDELEAYRASPEHTTRDHRGPQPTLLPPRLEEGPQWAMSIDTSICTGCSSCVVACQAENNIPIVGKTGVEQGRIMHWIRIDTYRRGAGDAVHVINQPMLCQHCEHAPCEYVCPVYATTHSPDGLNEMTYNRCVGTRFCSNNCPYKVRRFNWFDYTESSEDSPRHLQWNPDVTVRARGVMEKCTYCVQRIRRGQIQARLEGRELATGEIVTACQQACPTGAITFGDMRDPDAEVSRWRQQPRRYDALHELGTRPRTQYLAKIENPNPALGKERP